MSRISYFVFRISVGQLNPLYVIRTTLYAFAGGKV
jgi:hypothetical protein